MEREATVELELTFALPAPAPALLPQVLARMPLIGPQPPRRQQVLNTYYDTPSGDLQRQGVALRVRRLGNARHALWLQTLKIGRAGSALRQRGEWELELERGQLCEALLADTPWPDLDPQGRLFAALVPVCTTRYERLSWTVALPEGLVEVALDRGRVEVKGRSAPLCELEIESLSGTPLALLDAAAQIGQQLCLLPLHLGKAERAALLAKGQLEAPLCAQPPVLRKTMSLDAMAHAVLGESFLQFSANLLTLLSSDAPEVLHQARVGWRRFRGALRLFRPAAQPSLQPLRPLLAQLALLRDVDVAQGEVLPPFAEAFQAGDAQRALQWQALEAALVQERHAQAQHLRQLLADPSLGQGLLQITRWLALPQEGTQTKGLAHKPRRDAKRKAKHPQRHKPAPRLRDRLADVAHALQRAQRRAHSPQALHRLRILSKRLRYGVESLRTLLPKRRAQRWHHKALQVQRRIGQLRDQQQAVATAQRLQAPEAVLAFLRGAAFGAQRR